MHQRGGSRWVSESNLVRHGEKQQISRQTALDVFAICTDERRKGSQDRGAKANGQGRSEDEPPEPGRNQAEPNVPTTFEANPQVEQSDSQSYRDRELNDEASARIFTARAGFDRSPDSVLGTGAGVVL